MYDILQNWECDRVRFGCMITKCSRCKMVVHYQCLAGKHIMPALCPLNIRGSRVYQCSSQHTKSAVNIDRCVNNFLMQKGHPKKVHLNMQSNILHHCAQSRLTLYLFHLCLARHHGLILPKYSQISSEFLFF